MCTRKDSEVEIDAWSIARRNNSNMERQSNAWSADWDLTERRFFGLCLAVDRSKKPVDRPVDRDSFWVKNEQIPILSWNPFLIEFKSIGFLFFKDSLPIYWGVLCTTKISWLIRSPLFYSEDVGNWRTSLNSCVLTFFLLFTWFVQLVTILW